MAQQPAANESTPLSAPDLLHPTMEQQVQGCDPRTISNSVGSKIITKPSVVDAALSSCTPSRSSTMMQLDHEDEKTSLSSVPQHSDMEQQHEGREPNPRVTFNSQRVEDESTQPFFSAPMHPGTDQQHEHSPSSLSTSGEFSPNLQLSVRNDSASNTFAQQVEIQQHCAFQLSDPTQSTIMLRRNAHAESASADCSSTSQEGIQNVSPRRVKQLISTLGFDDQRSEMLYKLVIATAPFHTTESLLTPPAPEESSPKADTLREVLDSLVFAPNSASPIESRTATTAEEGSLAGNSNDNTTGDLRFDANAAENLGSCPVEPCPNSPPLLWSTAAAEESLDPDAEDPTYFTIAEFINTIVEKGIQVESVTDEDWWIEDVRVAILNRLKQDASEEDLKAEEDLMTEEDLMAREDANEVVMTKEEATEQVKAKENTSESDLQRWKEQGREGWLKREDGTDMNEEEVDEECARWDAMVMKARNETEVVTAAPSLGKNFDLKDKAFWNFVRSSKQKEQSQGSISTHGQDEKALVSTHDDEGKASQKKNKGSRKNKNKNRKAKKNALEDADAEDAPEESRDTKTLSKFLDLPTEGRNKVLGCVLIVHQELVPYHYVKDKVVKDVGLRKKPELNILLALCSSKDNKVKKCLDDAKNILYRDNTFSIRKPNDLIMFLGTIGGDSLARMEMGKNLLLTDTFFDKKCQYILEMKWLARWGKDLLFAMKGHNIFRSDIAAESSEDDLTCEPTDIEKALKSMVEVMKDEGKMYEMLKENGSGSSPTRLQSLDLGEKFGSLADQIKNMGLAVGDGKVTKSDTAVLPETDAPDEAVESMSEKWKRKAREAGKEVEDQSKANEYRQHFLKVITTLDEEDEDKILNQESGFYTPSVYSEHDEAGGRGEAASKSTATLDSDSDLEREMMDLMEASSGASE